MLTPPPAAVTATTNDELASSFCNAATPSKGVVLASAGARDTHGDGSIDSEQRRSENEESPQSLFSERVERERKWKKTRLFFYSEGGGGANEKNALSLSPSRGILFYFPLSFSVSLSRKERAKPEKKKRATRTHNELKLRNSPKTKLLFHRFYSSSRAEGLTPRWYISARPAAAVSRNPENAARADE